MNHSLAFFSRQFESQIARGEFALNPFETRALPHLHGQVIDLGCGLGNLALAAGRRRLDVKALDGCPHAVASLQQRADAEHLHIRADVAELSTWQADGLYDSVVCIGLLMFFRCETARALIGELRRSTRPGGVLVLNVLVEGTTFMSMFERGAYCLFPQHELRALFDDWSILEEVVEAFPAGRSELKRFVTLIARAPG
jgi:tellurite methyltransferase